MVLAAMALVKGCGDGDSSTELPPFSRLLPPDPDIMGLTVYAEYIRADVFADRRFAPVNSVRNRLDQ